MPSALVQIYGKLCANYPALSEWQEELSCDSDLARLTVDSAEINIAKLSRGASVKSMLETALLFLGVGLQRRDEGLLRDALAKALSLMELLDRKGRPFSGLLSSPSEFSHAAFYGLGYLLFAAAAHIAEWPKYHLVAESLLTHFKELPVPCYAKVEPLHVALAHFFEKELEKEGVPLIRGTPEMKSYEKELGVASYHNESLSIGCSSTGSHSGVCGMSKNGIRIVSMGPSRSPIGEEENFGVMRIPPVADAVVERGDETFDFACWTRLASKNDTDLSKTWMELKVAGRRGRGKIGVKFTDLEESLHFLFFVQGEKATVGEQFSLEAGTLDRFSGVENRVSVKNGVEVINIQAVDSESIEVIPLAGSDHFWGADFLVAYKIPSRCKSMTWDIF